MDLKWLFLSFLFLLSSSSPLPSFEEELDLKMRATGKTKSDSIPMWKEPNTKAGTLKTYGAKGAPVYLACMVAGEDFNGSGVWYQNFDWLCTWYIFCDSTSTPGWLHEKDVEVTSGVPPMGMSNCLLEV